jgi:ABC-type multidrug transport system ATPase subunit
VGAQDALVIRICDLTVVLAGRPILSGITLDVARGEAVGLVGANGSGKSTLLRCLLGLVPFQGHVSIGGRDVLKDPVGAKSLAGYLPQKPAFGDATAEEALRFIAHLRGIDRRRIAEVLEEVGLSEQAGQRARTFSGGMQQRLSLAAALLTSAPVLLLDEPTASLDLEGQRTFVEIAALLRQKERTLLIASHRPEEIARLTTRVVRLDKGRVVPAEAELPQARVLPLHAVGGVR